MSWGKGREYGVEDEFLKRFAMKTDKLEVIQK